MPRLRPPSRPARLLALFVVATILPAGALAWLGWRLVEQDRQLERQRVQDLLDRTATDVAATLERELAAIDRNLRALAGSTDGALQSDTAVALHITRSAGVTSMAGAKLLYWPVQPPVHPEPPDSLWREAEVIEFRQHDYAAAVRAYRTFARSPEPGIRAGALIRLARALRNSGRANEALETYAEATRIEDATILGTPADLFARGARLDLLHTVGREDLVHAEGSTLAADLQQGRWHLDRTTYLQYAQALEDLHLLSRDDGNDVRVALSEAVGTAWNEWSSVRAMLDTIFVVSSAQDDELLIFAAAPAHLLQAWPEVWATSDVAVSLVDQQGRRVAGTLPDSDPSAAAALKPASDTGLPWTIRVAATTMPGEIAASGAARRRVIVAGLILLGVLIPATGYLVIRSVRKELSVARQQAEFIAAVSHEFRSPLTSLTHLTSLLRSDFQPSESRRTQYYDVLAHETDRLRRFVETLLDFGRIQAGAARYHLAPVDLVPAVSSVVEEFRRHAASGGHDVTCATTTPLPMVDADAEALGRALWNLLENAAKYSPADSPIAVRLETDDRRVAIRVSDRGPGIPAAEQPLVFDQFFRGAAAAASTTKGTGVGLAVVRHIVRARRRYSAGQCARRRQYVLSDSSRLQAPGCGLLATGVRGPRRDRSPKPGARSLICLVSSWSKTSRASRWRSKTSSRITGTRSKSFVTARPQWTPDATPGSTAWCSTSCCRRRTGSPSAVNCAPSVFARRF